MDARVALQLALLAVGMFLDPIAALIILVPLMVPLLRISLSTRPNSA
ncbi:MAG: hypothetical protein H0U56_05115 [Methylibium sp.]|nr:hypothetical protein [Methylibium sp.]